MNIGIGLRFSRIEDIAACTFWPYPVECGLGVGYAKKIAMEDRMRYMGNFPSATKGYVDFPLKNKLTISEKSEDPIARALSSRQMDPFHNFEMDWIGGDENGPGCEEMRGWNYQRWYENVVDTDTGVIDNSGMGTDSDYRLECDFTIVPYCFAYCMKLHADRELSEEVMRRFSCFVDGDSAVTGYGYFSPSYAVSLYQSLVLCGKVEQLLTSYRTFWSKIRRDEISEFVLPEQLRYDRSTTLLRMWPYDGEVGASDSVDV